MWVRLDDAFPQHPKVIGLTDRAFRAHVEGLCYAARYLTDGHLPHGFTGQYADVLDELTAAGVWRRGAGGRITVHDYLDWNPPAEAAKERQAARAAAKRKGGKMRADHGPRNPDGTYASTQPAGAPAGGFLVAAPAGKHLAANPSRFRRSGPAQPAGAPADSQQEATPVPVPVPVPITETDIRTRPEASTASSPRKGLLRVDEDMTYLLGRLVKHDGRWATLTPAALVKLGKEFGMGNVKTALGFCREDLPEGVRSPYAYLRQVAATVAAERGTLPG